ncbi:MAG TPA: phosphate/phosphite/phosphonate ABC transporter substrate-binding protein [Terrimicrobiaceae bacterium]
MKFSTNRLITLLVVIWIVPQMPAASPTSLSKVVVALKPDKDPDAMVAERAQLSKYLSEKLGRPVEVIVPLSGSVILEGLSNGTVDLAYLSATDMLNAINQQSASILLAGEIDGVTSYKSYWVTLKDKPYQSVADLKGKPIAFSGRTSTSGYVIPLWDLRQKNLISDSGKAEEFFGAGNVWFGSGYVSAVERVLNGDAEAAAVSYYVLDKDKHLTAEQRQRLRRLAEQGPVPTHVIAIRSKISDEDREALRAALVAMDEQNPELRDRVFTSRLVEVDAASHLGSLKDSIALAKRGSE